jgi:hypothetical protein
MIGVFLITMGIISLAYFLLYLELDLNLLRRFKVWRCEKLEGINRTKGLRKFRAHVEATIRLSDALREQAEWHETRYKHVTDKLEHLYKLIELQLEREAEARRVFNRGVY